MRRFRSAYRRTGVRLLQIHAAHGIFEIPIHLIRPRQAGQACPALRGICRSLERPLHNPSHENEWCSGSSPARSRCAPALQAGQNCT